MHNHQRRVFGGRRFSILPKPRHTRAYRCATPPRLSSECAVASLRLHPGFPMPRLPNEAPTGGVVVVELPPFSSKSRRSLGRRRQAATR